MNRKQKWIWTLITMVLAVISVFLVIKQASGRISVGDLYERIRQADSVWIVMACISSIGFVYFEGKALLTILRCAGFQRNAIQGILYGAADNYFSAITPSASGGQPVCAFFMLLSGIPASMVTAVIVLNLVLYIAAILFTGVLALILWPGVLFAFNPISYCFIAFGFVVLVGLTIGFLMVLKNRAVLERFMNGIYDFLTRIHIMHHSDERKEKLKETMDEYETAVRFMTGETRAVLLAFLYNVLQRLSQVLVSFFVYLAFGGKLQEGFPLISIQTFVSIGSYSVPVPGGMGVVDYLMLNGFQTIMAKTEAVQLELISRGISFYMCVILSGIIVVMGYLFYAKDIYAKH